MAAAFRSVALIEKTHGRKGEVVVRPAHGLPFLLREGMVVALLPPALKGPRWREVLSCTEARGAQLVRFAGVSDLDGAGKLVGKTVLARTDDLPKNYYLSDVDYLIGMPVEDERLGSLGTIVEVMRGPMQDVWVVEGAYGEVLIPAVDALVHGVDDTVRVRVPDGLVDTCGPSGSSADPTTFE